MARPILKENQAMATTITLTDGTEELRSTLKDAKADLRLKTEKVSGLIDSRESVSITIGRVLVDVETSGLGLAFLTAKAIKDGGTAGQGFTQWTEKSRKDGGLGLTRSSRSKYRAHASMVDALIGLGLAPKTAEAIGQDGAVALGQRTDDAEAALAVVRAILKDGRVVSRAAVLEYTETEDDSSGTATTSDDDDDAETIDRAALILNANAILGLMIDAAESDAPVSIDGLTTETIDRARAILDAWEVSVNNN